jgi:hypothetical protein
MRGEHMGNRRGTYRKLRTYLLVLWADGLVSLTPVDGRRERDESDDPFMAEWVAVFTPPRRGHRRVDMRIEFDLERRRVLRIQDFAEGELEGETISITEAIRRLDANLEGLWQDRAASVATG